MVNRCARSPYSTLVCLFYTIDVKDLAANIPTAESLKLTSRAVTEASDPLLPPSTTTESKLKRDDWMLDPTATPVIPDIQSRMPPGIPDDDTSMDVSPDGIPLKAIPATSDFFSSLGTELRPKAPPKNPDQDKVRELSGCCKAHKV